MPLKFRKGMKGVGYVNDLCAGHQAKPAMTLVTHNTCTYPAGQAVLTVNCDVYAVFAQTYRCSELHTCFL